MIDWEGGSFAQYFHVPAFSRDLLIIQLFNSSDKDISITGCLSAK